MDITGRLKLFLVKSSRKEALISVSEGWGRLAVRLSSHYYPTYRAKHHLKVRNKTHQGFSWGPRDSLPV